MPPKTVRRKGVVVELHDSNDAHLRYFLEILCSAAGKAMLGPVEPLIEPFAGPYSDVLARADKWRAKDAAAKAEAKGEVAGRQGWGGADGLHHDRGGGSAGLPTVSEFRGGSLKALAGLFVQVLKLAEKAGLVKLGHVALDGTKSRRTHRSTKR